MRGRGAQAGGEVRPWPGFGNRAGLTPCSRAAALQAVKGNLSCTTPGPQARGRLRLPSSAARGCKGNVSSGFTACGPLLRSGARLPGLTVRMQPFPILSDGVGGGYSCYCTKACMQLSESAASASGLCCLVPRSGGPV